MPKLSPVRLWKWKRQAEEYGALAESAVTEGHHEMYEELAVDYDELGQCFAERRGAVKRRDD